VHRRCGCREIISANPAHRPAVSCKSRTDSTSLSLSVSIPPVTTTSQCVLTGTFSQLGVEFGSKLIEIPEENKIVKLQCITFYPPSQLFGVNDILQYPLSFSRLGHRRDRVIQIYYTVLLPWRSRLSPRLRRDVTDKYVRFYHPFLTTSQTLTPSTQVS
jgi:hypothetical protein